MKFNQAELDIPQTRAVRLVEWVFQSVEFALVAAAVQYAATKTGNIALEILALVLTSFVGSYVAIYAIRVWRASHLAPFGEVKNETARAILQGIMFLGILGGTLALVLTSVSSLVTASA